MWYDDSKLPNIVEYQILPKFLTLVPVTMLVYVSQSLFFVFLVSTLAARQVCIFHISILIQVNNIYGSVLFCSILYFLNYHTSFLWDLQYQHKIMHC